ncbi:MAG TPA: glycosyl transferase [Spirochaetia bacterium]|nr:glycosyl transferase [Spirochaetia bacterium]
MLEQIERLASRRSLFIKKNIYYYNDLVKFLRFNIAENSSVLEVGCSTGYLLSQLSGCECTGIDISPGIIKIAAEQHPGIEFLAMDAEQISLKKKFDYIILSDTLGYFSDLQKVFSCLRRVMHSGTRIIITYHNFIYEPLFRIAEIFRIKMPYLRLNWLNEFDIENLLNLENYEIVKKGRRLLFPVNIPVISWLINSFFAHLPFFNHFCITCYCIARPLDLEAQQEKSVSIIIPARNEAGNIERAVNEMPVFGKSREIIFIEGHSTDHTRDEIKKICSKKHKNFKLRYALQDGKGKGDAVRKGFSLARGEILMILDADLTVHPSELPKFYQAVISGRGEYINGSRLVYPMADEAMRFLNMLANKFFSLSFSLLLGQRFKDTLCGTKVLTRRNWEKIQAGRKFFGEFDPFGDFDLIFGAAKLALKIAEIPIRYRSRTYGSTNISRFRHGFLLFRMLLFAVKKFSV